MLLTKNVSPHDGLPQYYFSLSPMRFCERQCVATIVDTQLSNIIQSLDESSLILRGLSHAAISHRNVPLE